MWIFHTYFPSGFLLFFTAVVVAERTSATATTKTTTTTATLADTHIFTNQKSKRILPHKPVHRETHSHTHTYTQMNKRDRQGKSLIFYGFSGKAICFRWCLIKQLLYGVFILLLTIVHHLPAFRWEIGENCLHIHTHAFRFIAFYTSRLLHFSHLIRSSFR